MKKRTVLGSVILSAGLMLCTPVLAQEVVFTGDPCVISVSETTDLAEMKEITAGSLDVLGTVTGENGSYVVLKVDGKLLYTSINELNSRIPMIMNVELPAAENWTDITLWTNGDTVRRVQQLLIDKGLLTGSADGVYGQGSSGVVSAFQTEAGLEATGTVDAVTWLLLNETDTEPLETVYPMEYTAEIKYAGIYDQVRPSDRDLLDNFLDSEWTCTYDEYEGMGEITRGINVGTWEDTSGRPIDALHMSVDESIFLYRADTGYIEIIPSLKIETEGSHRPYVQSVYLKTDEKLIELETGYSQGKLEGTNVREIDIIPMTNEAYAILPESTLKVKGIDRDFDI